MKHKKHYERSRIFLGRRFSFVHKLLDSPHSVLGPGKQRLVLHNRHGIETCRKLWGDQAAKAAELHIKDDGVILNE